jgi:hypothetical protein
MKKRYASLIVASMVILSCTTHKAFKENVGSDIVNQILPTLVDSMKVSEIDLKGQDIAINPIYLLDTIEDRGFNITEVKSIIKNCYNYTFRKDSLYQTGKSKIVLSPLYVKDTLRIIAISSFEEAYKDNPKDLRRRVIIDLYGIKLNKNKNHGILSGNLCIGSLPGPMYTIIVNKIENKWHIEHCITIAIRKKL